MRNWSSTFTDSRSSFGCELQLLDYDAAFVGPEYVPKPGIFTFIGSGDEFGEFGVGL